MMRPLTILHATSDAEISGRARYILDLSRRQTRAGHTALIALPADRPGGPSLYDQLGGADTLAPFSRPLALGLRRIIRKIKPDLVHCHGGSVPRWLRFMPQRPATVATLHQRYKPAFRHMDGLIAIAPFQQAAMATYRGHQTLIPNWIGAMEAPDPASIAEARGLAGATETTRLIVFMGRLTEDKGADRLPALLKAVSDKMGAPVMLAAIGDGPLRAPLSRAPGLYLHGYDPAPARWYAAADLVVVPSRHEAFGLVAAEAMAMGTPVIGHDVGGLGDLLRTAGAVAIPPGDPDTFTQAAIEVLNGPAPDYDLTAYQAETAVQEIEAFYRHILQAG